MSSFFSIGGGRRGQGGGGGDSSNYNNPDREDDRNHQAYPREISFWYDRAEHGQEGFVEQCQQQQLDLQQNYSLSSRRTGSMDGGDDDSRMMTMMMTRGSRGGGGGGICCQDCGNQAKKDCVHLRCRTCCKSRGFDCDTHVKSTWVPATKRRERQQQLQQQHHHLQLSSSQALPRRQHQDQLAAGSSLASSHQGLELGNFPTELNSPAMFRCVRVSSDEGEDHDQYAYQTAVNIGGHVFRGILYDQGPDQIAGDAAAGESSSGGGSGGVNQPLSLGGGSTESGGAASAPLYDPYSSMYPAPFNPYSMAGTQFFLPPRP